MYKLNSGGEKIEPNWPMGKKKILWEAVIPLIKSQNLHIWLKFPWLISLADDIPASHNF